MINISSRQFRVQVGGLDVTSLVQYFEVGDDKISSSGLISTRGTIKLRYNPKFNIGRDPKISLDPKIPHSAPYWARGVAVKLWINDSTQTERKHPRHSLRILSTAFDRNELSLVIEVGCLLALLDSQQPEGDESDTCLNEKRSVDDVIRSLLIGGAKDYQCGEIIPTPGPTPVTIVYLGFVPGWIESPQEKGSGGSYVGEAGKLAYDRGYALWVTKDEEIKAIRILPKDSLPRLVLDADKDSFEYVRNDSSGSSGEIPYDRIRVSYSVVTLTETEQEYEQITEEFGVTEYTGDMTVLIRRTKIKDSVNFKTSTRFVKTEKWLRSSEIFPWAFTADTEKFGAHPTDILVLGEIIEESSVFEKPETILFEEACKDEGSKDNQGRLKKRTIKIKRARGWIYSEWIEQHYYRPPTSVTAVEIEIYQEGIAVLNGTNTSNVGTITGSQAYQPSVLLFNSILLETYSEDVTFYTYLDGSNGGQEGVKKIETKSKIHQAVVYPKAWKMSKRDSSLPEVLIPNGGITETWKRHFGVYEWQHKVVERRAMGIAFRSLCDAKMKKAIENANSLGVYTVEVDVERFNAISKVKSFSEQIVALNENIRVSSTQTTPPSPEFIPERYSRTEETVVQEFPITSQYSTGCTGKIKEIKLDKPVERKVNNGSELLPINGINPGVSVGLRGVQDDLEQAKNAAEIEALLVWGRYRSINLTYDLRDIWFDLPHLPLIRFDIYDRDRITEQTYRHSYIVDGWTNAVTLRECLCSHEGLWQGTAQSVNPVQIPIAATILPNATYIEVDSLPYAVQEGDYIVIDKTGSIIAQNTLQGASVLGLNVALNQTLVAGSQILLGGFVYTVQTTANAGSLSIALTSPLRSPISSGQSGTLGIITQATAYTPVGSTAIPVTPTTNTTTITANTVTIDVQTVIPPARLPVTFTADLILGSTTTVFETVAPITFEAALVLRYPAGNFINIGSANFNANLMLGYVLTSNLNTTFSAGLLLEAQISQSAELEAALALGASITSILQTAFNAGLLLSASVDISEPQTLFSAGLLLGASVETQLVATFSANLTLGATITPVSQLGGSFEIIAVW